MLAENELSEDERRIRKALLEELLALRAKAAEPNAVSLATLVGRGPWHFPDLDRTEAVVILCPELPPEVRKGMPQAEPTDLDFSQISRLGDLDALFELYGHIRAVNPDARVEYRSGRVMRPEDSNRHLVVLGGVDWNPAQRGIMKRVDAPIEQISKDDPLRRGYRD